MYTYIYTHDKVAGGLAVVPRPPVAPPFPAPWPLHGRLAQVYNHDNNDNNNDDNNYYH